MLPSSSDLRDRPISMTIYSWWLLPAHPGGDLAQATRYRPPATPPSPPQSNQFIVILIGHGSWQQGDLTYTKTIWFDFESYAYVGSLKNTLNSKSIEMTIDDECSIFEILIRYFVISNNYILSVCKHVQYVNDDGFLVALVCFYCNCSVWWHWDQDKHPSALII